MGGMNAAAMPPCRKRHCPQTPHLYVLAICLLLGLGLGFDFVLGFVWFGFFKTGFHWVALAVLELAL